MVALIPIAVALATGGGAFGLAYLIKSTYEGKIYSLIKDEEESAQGDEFPANYGLSESLALDVIGKMRYYAIHGLSIDINAQFIQMRNNILMDLKLPNEQAMKTRLLAYMTIVRETVKTIDDDLYEYLRGGLTDRDKIINRSTSISEKSNKFLPFYLNPKKILIIGGVIYGLYLTTPLWRALFKRVAK